MMDPQHGENSGHSHHNTHPLSWAVIFRVIILLFVLGIPAWFYYLLRLEALGNAHRFGCSSNLRQIALAINMYAQDNKGHYPGIDGSSWVAKVAPYLGHDYMKFQCPVNQSPKVRKVSYALAGHLLGSGGKGINASQVLSPSEVGMVADALPTTIYPDGRLIGGAALHDLAVYAADIDIRRHRTATVIGYCDGHAYQVMGDVNVSDLDDPAVRAFFQAVSLGIIDNPIACIPDFITGHTSREPIAIGGEYCTRAILQAAAGAWKTKLHAPVDILGFNGQFNPVKRPANYLWGTGDGRKPKGNAVPIARDAVVLIVAKGSKIPALPTKSNSSYLVDFSTIRQLLNTGYSPDSVQVYTFNTKSGTRQFLVDKLAQHGKPLQIGIKAVSVATDLEMVERVSNDPYGIGYCSSVFADIERVTILALKVSDGQASYYPQESREDRWVLPDQPTWPWTRTLYAEYGGAAWKADGSGIANVMLAPGGAGTAAMREGPLFAGGLWTPK